MHLISINKMTDNLATWNGAPDGGSKDIGVYNSTETPLGGSPPNYQACTVPDAPPEYYYGYESAQPSIGNYPPQYGPPPSAHPGYPTQPMAPTQPAYPVQPPPGVPVVIPAAPAYREVPLTIVCQHCNATVTTSMTYENGTFTWLIAGAVCLFGGCLGCCLIPFCVDACKEVIHTCPNCHRIVGRYTRM